LFLYSDGAGRTGTYIAISNLLERMKIEQAMDVFQSIKIIRGARPQFVENAVSMLFVVLPCHICVDYD
jgi:protein tyrosine phosphatase